MKNPFFSIITVVFNGENEIEKTINSVLNQSFDDFEYIIIDGKSTDKTLSKIKKYDDNRIKVISESDNGIYDAMNKGLKIVKGKVVGILNCGDLFLKNTIKIIYDKIKSENLILTSNFIITGGLKLINIKTKKFICLKNNNDSLKKLKHFMSIYHPSTFVSNQTYIDHGLFNHKYKISGDYDLMYRFYSKDINFFFVNEILVEMDDLGASTKFKGVVQSAKETFIIRSNRVNLFTNLFYSIKTIIGYFYKKLLK